jgi:predicted flap endonuclease-1-like 5' DNA nuclease
MIQVIQANWIALALALLLGLLVAWWLFRRGSTGPERHHAPDVLDAGQAPAQRNQALIDAPPAAAIIPPPMSIGMAGLGEIIAVAAQDEVEEAEVKAKPEPEPEPAHVAPPAPEPEAVPIAASTDDLSRIKGLGPKLQALLPTLGITTFAQIAALSEADLAELNGKLGAFAGRPARDGWVEQARYLAAGDVAGFEGRFGKV